MRNTQKKAEFFLLLCTLFWGGSFAATKIGLEQASPMFFLFIRFSISSILFLPFVWRRLNSGEKKHRLTIQRGLLLGFLVFLGFALQTAGLRFTTASKSGFITELLVIFTAIFQIIIRRRPLDRGSILGIPVVITGLYLLTQPTGPDINIGDLLTFFCAICFGLYIVVLDIFSGEDDLYILIFLQLIVTAVLSLLAASVEGFQFSSSVDLWLSLLYLVPFATIGTFYLQTRFQKDTTPVRAAVIFVMEPVFSAVFAGLLLGEKLGSAAVIGGILIVTGLVFSEILEMFRTRRRGAG